MVGDSDSNNNALLLGNHIGPEDGKIFKALKGNNFQPRILHPEKNILKE